MEHDKDELSNLQFRDALFPVRRNFESERGTQVVCVHDYMHEAIDHRASDARAAADETSADVPNQKHGAVVVHVKETRLTEFLSQHHENRIGEIHALGQKISIHAVKREIVSVVDFVADQVIAIFDEDGQEAEEKH